MPYDIIRYEYYKDDFIYLLLDFSALFPLPSAAANQRPHIFTSYGSKVELQLT